MIMTGALADKYNITEQFALIQAFSSLIQAFPKERHFSIEFVTANNGQGEKVWLIIDESETERIDTMLLPEDY